MSEPRPRRAAVCLTAILSLQLLALAAGPVIAQRNLKDIPPPDPELERKSFIVPAGFEVNLFAADPQIAKPIQMNFDAEGRLWIASSEVYPHIKPGQKANDKILVISDANRDGKADKVRVFADDLLIPTGVLPGDGGVYVANSTQLIHLSDEDNDGRADRRRVVLSGFGTEDTHHLLHTLRWGHDGALYMNQSIYIHSHIETPYGVRRLNGGGIWRFKPNLQELEIVCRGFVNPWGNHFDRWGQQFATDGAYGEGINYVFPGAVYVTAPGAKRRLQGLNPGSPKHCGLEILSGPHLPPEWRGSMVTNDFRAHRVCRFVVSEDGAGYASRQAVEVIKSKHVAFRPIDVKMGPDGAIYIADWYNPIIQHGEVDFRDPRRDHVHGRIWRVSAMGRPLAPKTKIRGASIDALLEMLKREEQWIRLHAKLELKAHGAKAVVPALQKWLQSLDAADPQSEHHRLEALWLREALNAPDERLLKQLAASADHRVRAAAVRMAVYWLDRLEKRDSIFRRAVADPHPRVRLEAVRGLAQQPQTESAVLALQVLDRPMDRFLDFALWQTMRDLQPHWLPQVRAGRLDFGGDVKKLAFALKAVDSPDVVQPLLRLAEDASAPLERLQSVVQVAAALGKAQDLARLAPRVLQHPGLKPADRADLLRTLVRQSAARGVRPDIPLQSLDALFAAKDVALRTAAAEVAGGWKVAGARPQLVAWAQDAQREPPVRHAAIQALAALGGAANRDVLIAVARSAPLADREQAVAALARVDVSRAAAEAIRLLGQVRDPAAVFRALLERKQGAAALEKALRNRKLKPDVAKLAIRAVQRSAQPSKPLIAALRTAGRLDDSGWKLEPTLVAQLVQEVKTRGNPARGQAIYRRRELQCLKCHAIGGSGGKVGPDLVSIGASAQPDYLLESLIAPNKKVKENFHSLNVQTDEGKLVSGIPVRKSPEVLVLRDAEDREITLPADSIVATREGRSLMPDGLVDSLTRDELIHLTRFLSELGKVGPYAVGKERYVRTWRVLLPTRAALHRIRRSSFDSAASDDAAFTWQPAYSLVSGALPVTGLPTFDAPTYVRGNQVKIVFLRAQLSVTTPGKVGLRFDRSEGLQLWVDGKPTPLRARDVTLRLGRGTHALTLAVDALAREKRPVRLELRETDSEARAQVVGGK